MTKVLPTLRKRLADKDPRCRLMAAETIWKKTHEPELKSVFLSLVDSWETSIRAMDNLMEIAKTDPEMFEPLSKLAEDRRGFVGVAATASMSSYGKRGISVLRRHLRGQDRELARAAIGAAGELGADATELIPDVLRWENDPDRMTRWMVMTSLHQIAPKRFPEPPPPFEP
jgi:hypothetical protein